MRDLLGGKGAGLAEMTNAGLPVPPGFTITTEACNDYFAAGKQLPDGLWEDVLRRGRGRRGAAPARASANAGEPAPGQRPLRGQVLHARDDGHGPQPGPQRARPWQGLVGSDRQRALRLGCLPPVHPDVRPDRDGRGRATVRPRARCRQARSRRDARTPISTPPPCASSPRRVQGDRPRRTPVASSRPIRTSSWTWPSRPSSPAGSASGPATTAVQPEDRPRPGHRGQRGDDGLRQHGRRLGHGRGVHARPEHGREGALRRVPDQRPGRGRGGRHPDGPKIAQMATEMPAVYAEFQQIGHQLERHYRDVQDLEFTIERGKLYMLQTRSAKRTAAAAVRIAVDMVRRGPDHEGRGRRPDRAGPGRPAPAGPVRSRRPARPLPGSPRASMRRPARPSARPSSTPTPPSSGSTRRAGRPRPDRDLARTTSTGWPSPRAS